MHVAVAGSGQTLMIKKKGTAAQCVALTATTRRRKVAYRVPSLWLYSKLVSVSFGAR